MIKNAAVVILISTASISSYTASLCPPAMPSHLCNHFVDFLKWGERDVVPHLKSLSATSSASSNSEPRGFPCMIIRAPTIPLFSWRGDAALLYAPIIFACLPREIPHASGAHYHGATKPATIDSNLSVYACAVYQEVRVFVRIFNMQTWMQGASGMRLQAPNPAAGQRRPPRRGEAGQPPNSTLSSWQLALL